jgi:hypothetical protein
MAIYRHYARKQEREEQSSSNTWRTISAEERKQRKGKAYIGRSNQPGPGINLQENPDWGFPRGRSLSDLHQ